MISAVGTRRAIVRVQGAVDETHAMISHISRTLELDRSQRANPFKMRIRDLIQQLGEDHPELRRQVRFEQRQGVFKDTTQVRSFG
jgi:hypothetical protein